MLKLPNSLQIKSNKLLLALLVGVAAIPGFLLAGDKLQYKNNRLIPGIHFQNGDFESGDLWPWVAHGSPEKNRFEIISDSRIVPNGKYCLKITLAQEVIKNASIRPRAEINYYGRKGNNWSKNENLMEYWDKGNRGLPGSELWYSWKFMLKKMPEIEVGALKKFKITMGQFHTPTPSLSKKKDKNGKPKIHQSSPILSLNLKKVPKSGNWFLWHYQTVLRSARYGARSPIPILPRTWYQIILRVKWSDDPKLASSDVHIKPGLDSVSYAFVEDPQDRFADTNLTDGILSGQANFHSGDFGGRLCYFKIGMYLTKEHQPRNSNELILYLDDIEVNDTKPNFR